VGRVSLLTPVPGLILRYEGGTKGMASLRRIPLIVGHRANTIARIKKFLSHGVHVIEIDVIRDLETGELILHHAREDELFKLSIERKASRLIEFMVSHIPFMKPKKLYDILKMLSGRADVMLDIKWRGLVRDLAELLHEIDFKGNVYVTSKYHRDLLEIKRLAPKVKTLVSFDDQPIMCAEYVAKLKADGASVRVAFVDKELVNEMHRHGYILAAWTVNDITIAKYLASLGVDMIITDIPIEIIKGFKKAEEEKIREEEERVRIEESGGRESIPVLGGIDHMFGFEFYQSLKRKQEEEGRKT